MKTCFLGGVHYGAYAPIGYKKHPELKGKIISDEETRWIVEKIFDLAAHRMAELPEIRNIRPHLRGASRK